MLRLAPRAQHALADSSALLLAIHAACRVVTGVLPRKHDLEVIRVVVGRIVVLVVDVVTGWDSAVRVRVNLPVEVALAALVGEVAVWSLPPRCSPVPDTDHSASPFLSSPAATQPRAVRIG
jgi:hypothetical protein